MLDVLAGAGALLLIAIVLWSYVSDKPTRGLLWLLEEIAGFFVGLLRIAVWKSFRPAPRATNDFDGP